MANFNSGRPTNLPTLTSVKLAAQGRGITKTRARWPAESSTLLVRTHEGRASETGPRPAGPGPSLEWSTSPGGCAGNHNDTSAESGAYVAARRAGRIRAQTVSHSVSSANNALAHRLPGG